jgi:hypothetical protein
MAIMALQAYKFGQCPDLIDLDGFTPIFRLDPGKLWMITGLIEQATLALFTSYAMLKWRVAKQCCCKLPGELGDPEAMGSL